jgi:hypothetical protein
MVLWNLGVHTVWQIINKRSETLRNNKPQQMAVSLDEFGALSLLHKALNEEHRVTLLFSSGTGLTADGPARYTNTCYGKDPAGHSEPGVS